MPIKVCLSEIWYIRVTTSLKVSLYACFEGYMLVMLWCMLEAWIWYIIEAMVHAWGTYYMHGVRHIFGTCMRYISWWYWCMFEALLDGVMAHVWGTCIGCCGTCLRHVFVSFGICLEAHLGYFEYGLLYDICLRNIMSDVAHVWWYLLVHGLWMLAHAWGTCF